MRLHTSLQLTGCWISLSLFLSVWCLYAAAAEIAFKRVVLDPQPPTNPWTKMVADFNGDGRLDVVLSPAEPQGGVGRVAWYEAPRDSKATGWTEHIIAREIESVLHGLGVADLDGDGQLDVVVAQMHQGADPDEVMVFRNRGKGLTWTKQVLSTRGSHDIVVVDIDKDGDRDTVGANHGGAYPSVELLENLSRGRGITASPRP